MLHRFALLLSLLLFSSTVFSVMTTLLLSQASAQEQRGRVEAPIIIGGNPDLPACPGNAYVSGLDPRGDGFLAVKAAPNIQSARIDKIFNGQQVYLCRKVGAWYGIVYSRQKLNCNATSPWPYKLAYTGPCAYGWVHSNYITPYAGGDPD